MKTNYQVDVVQLPCEIEISAESVALLHLLVVDAALLVDEVRLEFGQQDPEGIHQIFGRNFCRRRSDRFGQFVEDDEVRHL
jgi:hypothetical protein